MFSAHGGGGKGGASNVPNTASGRRLICLRGFERRCALPDTTTLSEEQNVVFNEAVIALSELSGSNSEITISGDEVLDFYDTRLMSKEKAKDIYNVIMDLNFANNLVAGQKRKLENSFETLIRTQCKYAREKVEKKEGNTPHIVTAVRVK